jgi:hypothetical protein
MVRSNGILISSRRWDWSELLKSIPIVPFCDQHRCCAVPEGARDIYNAPHALWVAMVG